MTNNGTEKISMRKLLPKCVLVKFCMFKMFAEKKVLWTKTKLTLMECQTVKCQTAAAGNKMLRPEEP